MKKLAIFVSVIVIEINMQLISRLTKAVTETLVRAWRRPILRTFLHLRIQEHIKLSMANVINSFIKFQELLAPLIKLQSSLL